MVSWRDQFRIDAEQAKKVGEKLGVDWSRFDVEQFRVGMDVELEHGKVDPHTNVTDDDPVKTGKIALAHLNELPDYYTRLLKLEDQEVFWKNGEHNVFERCAIEQFGTTGNPDNAGFILRDGTMLDFGRKKGDETFKAHDEIRTCLPGIKYISQTQIINEFLKRTGAIRWDGARNSFYISTITSPTESQLDVMVPYFGKRYASVDIYNLDGSRCYWEQWQQLPGENADKKLRRMWNKCYHETPFSAQALPEYSELGDLTGKLDFKDVHSAWKKIGEIVDGMGCEELKRAIWEARTVRDQVRGDPTANFIARSFASQGSRKLRRACPDQYHEITERAKIKEMEPPGWTAQRVPEGTAGLKWYEVCKRCNVKRVKKKDEFGIYYECPKCGSQLYPGGLGVMGEGLYGYNVADKVYTGSISFNKEQRIFIKKLISDSEITNIEYGFAINGNKTSPVLGSVQKNPEIEEESIPLVGGELGSFHTHPNDPRVEVSAMDLAASYQQNESLTCIGGVNEQKKQIIKCYDIPRKDEDFDRLEQAIWKYASSEDEEKRRLELKSWDIYEKIIEKLPVHVYDLTEGDCSDGSCTNSVLGQRGPCDRVQPWVATFTEELGSLSPEAYRMLNNDVWFNKRINELGTIMEMCANPKNEFQRKNCDHLMGLCIESLLRMFRVITTPKDLTEPVEFFMNPDNVQMVKILTSKVNDQIAGRTTYGLRPGLAEKPGHILAWSNEGFWRVFEREYQPGEELRLDANYIFVPGTKKVLQAVAPQLDPLPLYRGSYEAKAKGEVPWEEGTEYWAKHMGAHLKEMKKRELYRQAPQEEMWTKDKYDTYFQKWENPTSGMNPYIVETPEPGFQKYYWIGEEKELDYVLANGVRPRSRKQPEVLYKTHKAALDHCGEYKKPMVFRVMVPDSWKVKESEGGQYLITRKMHPKHMFNIGPCDTVKGLAVCKNVGLRLQMAELPESIKDFNSDPYR